MAESSENNRIKKTAKHTAIYAVGTILRRITGFVMLPIYTLYLTPADYGVVALLTMAVDIVSILVGLRITQALFRYYVMAEKKQEKDEVVSTVLLTVIAGGSLGVVFLYAVSGPLSLVIFGSNDYINELQLFSFTILLNAITATCLSYIRVRRKPVLFVSINVVFLAVQVLFNIIFVVVMELHVLGVIYSALASGVIMALFLLIYTVVNVGIHYSRKVAKKLILFTAPLMLAALGGFCVTYMDKYILRLFGSLAEVGLYALAFRLSSIVSIVFEAINMSWSLERFEVVKQDNARKIFDQVFRYISVLLFLAGSGVALFAQDILWLMATPSFSAAGPVVPILVLAVIIRAFTVFNNLGIQLAERTRHIAEGTWLKAIVALLVYLLLIPLIGVYGAAIGLLFGNLVELRWNYVRSKHLYDMELQWKNVFIMGLVATIFVLVGISLPTNEIIFFIARIGLFCAMIYSIYILPVWAKDERKIMLAMMSKFLHVRRIAN